MAIKDEPKDQPKSSKISELQIVTIEQFKEQQKSVLRKNTTAVNFPLSKEDKDLIAAMQAKLYKLGGVGLAAPQVGSNKKIAVIYIPEEASLLRDNAKFYPMHVLINPSYTAAPKCKVIKDFEGCYSVATKAGMVPRYQAVDVEYYDESGKLHTLQATDFYARVLQHEIDHLNGFLITDRLTEDCTQGTIAEMLEYRRNNLSEDKKQLLDNLLEKKGIVSNKPDKNKN